jgi:hypothetical protein
MNVCGAALNAAVRQMIRASRSNALPGVSASAVAFTLVAGLSWSAYGAFHSLPLQTASSVIAACAQLQILRRLRTAGDWRTPSQTLTVVLGPAHGLVTVVFGLGSAHIAVAWAYADPVGTPGPRGAHELRFERHPATGPAFLIANRLNWGLVGEFAGDASLFCWGPSSRCRARWCCVVTADFWLGPVKQTISPPRRCHGHGLCVSVRRSGTRSNPSGLRSGVRVPRRSGASDFCG